MHLFMRVFGCLKLSANFNIPSFVPAFGGQAKPVRFDRNVALIVVIKCLQQHKTGLTPNRKMCRQTCEVTS